MTIFLSIRAIGRSRMPTEDPLGLPVAYVRQILDLAEARGANRLELLQELGVDAGALEQADARVSLIRAAALFRKSLELTGDPALGFEVGLGSRLTTHGFVGYGLMAFPTLRDALEFGRRFVALRTPFVMLDYRDEDGQCLFEVREAVPLGRLRQTMMELFLSGIWRMLPQLINDTVAEDPDILMCFDFAEPLHYAAYRSQLPHCAFGRPVNGLQFPSRYLDLRLGTANQTTVELVTRQCEQEFDLLGGDAVSVTARVRALLSESAPSFPSLVETAKRFNLSGRSLKRKLRAEGAGYQALLDQVREREARRHLAAGRLSIGDIATRLGYTDPANFARAFRKWTGQSPRDYRQG